MLVKPTLARRRAVVVCECGRRLPAVLRTRAARNDRKTREVVGRMLEILARPADGFRNLAPDVAVGILAGGAREPLTMGMAVRAAAELSVACGAFEDAADPSAADPLAATEAK